MNHLGVMLQVFKEHQFFSEYSKCEFLLMWMTFLGHIISSDGLEVDPRKTKGVKNWPTPFTQTDIRSFLGLATYYQRLWIDLSLLHVP